MARKLPEINASSTADIAFLLLIFFLVTTTMDVDTGIARRLPPIADQPVKDQEQKIKERNVLVVLINKNDRLLVNRQEMDVNQLRAKAKEFIANPNNSIALPEKKDSLFQGLGKIGISKGIISLQNDRGTSYGMYIRVQNELTAAYNELRDEFSTNYFSKKFNDLPEPQQDIVKAVFPQRISEAEPKNIGGTK